MFVDRENGGGYSSRFKICSKFTSTLSIVDNCVKLRSSLPSFLPFLAKKPLRGKLRASNLLYSHCLKTLTTPFFRNCNDENLVSWGGEERQIRVTIFSIKVFFFDKAKSPMICLKHLVLKLTWNAYNHNVIHFFFIIHFLYSKISIEYIPRS